MKRNNPFRSDDLPPGLMSVFAGGLNGDDAIPDLDREDLDEDCQIPYELLPDIDDLDSPWEDS